jgi:hypothetical protein
MKSYKGKLQGDKPIAFDPDVVCVYDGWGRKFEAIMLPSSTPRRLPTSTTDNWERMDAAKSLSDFFFEFAN